MDFEKQYEEIEDTRRTRDANARLSAQYLIRNEMGLAMRHAETFKELETKLEALRKSLSPEESPAVVEP